MSSRKSKLTAPIKWHGGKHYLAPKIVALMPRHLHYVEAYAGGLAVLLERDPNDKRLWVSECGQRGGVSEVVNDINGHLMNFWETLKWATPFQEFQRLMQATPLGRTVFEEESGHLEWECNAPRPCVRCAVAFFVAARQSRAGTFKGFTTLSRNRTRRGINGNASEWLGAVEGLSAVHARLQPVVLENLPALKLIEREDTPDTLFYLDPPYLHEDEDGTPIRVTTDAYAFEMTPEEHAELLSLLVGLKGKWILSGYPSKLYESVFKDFPHSRYEFDLPNHAAGGEAKRRMTEVLWCNFSPA